MNHFNRFFCTLLPYFKTMKHNMTNAWKQIQFHHVLLGPSWASLRSRKLRSGGIPETKRPSSSDHHHLQQHHAITLSHHHRQTSRHVPQCINNRPWRLSKIDKRVRLYIIYGSIYGLGDETSKACKV